MVVVDTSALVGAFLVDPPPGRLLARLAEESLHAPHLLDVEFTHTARRLVRTGEISLDRARRGRSDFAGFHITRYPHTLFLDRMWELRDNISAYDAAFVALSEALDVPLVTTDSRLAGAPGHRATIEVY